MPSKTILDCDKALREAWPRLLKQLSLRYPGYRLRIHETHIPPEEQRDRYNIGRNGLGEVVDDTKIVTDVDGTEHMSPHNFYPSRAVCFDIFDPNGYRCFDTHILNTIAAISDACNVKFLAPDILMVTKASK